jgi:hypothetical protein
VDQYGRSGPEILEHSPRQWRIPGRRGLPPLVAALVLAGGIGGALAAGLGPAGGAHHPRAAAAAAGMCRTSASPVGHAVHVLPQSGVVTYCVASGSIATLPVACSTVIGGAPTGRQAGDRVVLGAVSVPPTASYGRMQPRRASRWRFWLKAALLIRGWSPAVTVSVPAAWRDREAITWAGSGIASTLRIGSCPPSGTWNVYPGGFYTRSPESCVPLRFQLGGRSATAWFGLGRRCPASLTSMPSA